MHLKSFQVYNFRNIVDSGEVEVDNSVTCLVGKNEAGKSALLEALYLLNPAYGEDTFGADEQYPRWLSVQDRKQEDLNERKPISAVFELSESDISAVEEVLGAGVLTGSQVTLKKKYGGKRSWDFGWNEKAAVDALVSGFPESLHPQFAATETLDELLAELEPSEAGEGEETHSEDVQAAWQAIDAAGLRDTGVFLRVVAILKPRVPVFFRFTQYSTLPGRVDIEILASEPSEGPARSADQTARALLRLAGTTTDDISQEDYEFRRGELDAVQIDLTNQVFEYWKQNPDLEVSIDVDKETVWQQSGNTVVARYLDIRLRDKRTGYSNNFSQRSSGFQWFFSFLAAFSEFEEDDRSVVVLLDEPALTLHGRAQGDFLRFINERLAIKSQVLYTTHSPFMVEPGHLERVRIVEDNGPPQGATATSDVLTGDPDSLFPLQAALGYDIAQSLFIGPHNLVVEGTSDYIYAAVLSSRCLASGRSGLDSNWRLLPAGGATNIPTFVSLIGPHLEATVLVDSDAKGMQRVNNMVKRGLLLKHRLILVSNITEEDHSDIEDLFSVGDYLMLYNKTFSTDLKVRDLPQGDRITKRIEHLRGGYDHGQVAETLLRDPHIDLTDSTLNSFETLFNAINATLDEQPR